MNGLFVSFSFPFMVAFLYVKSYRVIKYLVRGLTFTLEVN